MCTNDVNSNQLESMIDMTNNYLAVGYRWSHTMTHMAVNGGFTSASEKLLAAQLLLADARALLDEAKLCIEEGITISNEITVKLV